MFGGGGAERVGRLEALLSPTGGGELMFFGGRGRAGRTLGGVALSDARSRGSDACRRPAIKSPTRDACSGRARRTRAGVPCAGDELLSYILVLIKLWVIN